MKSILIVDDEFGLTETLCDLLVNCGYHADKAWNGQLAIKKISEKRPDLVITDVMMPIQNGLDLLRALKAKTEWRDIPVVLMSAAPCSSLPASDLAKSASFLSKPFEIDELLALIHRLIGAPD